MNLADRLLTNPPQRVFYYEGCLWSAPRSASHTTQSYQVLLIRLTEDKVQAYGFDYPEAEITGTQALSTIEEDGAVNEQMHARVTALHSNDVYRPAIYEAGSEFSEWNFSFADPARVWGYPLHSHLQRSYDRRALYVALQIGHPTAVSWRTSTYWAQRQPEAFYKSTSPITPADVKNSFSILTKNCIRDKGQA
jgi:hypothetical protein